MEYASWLFAPTAGFSKIADPMGRTPSLNVKKCERSNPEVYPAVMMLKHTQVMAQDIKKKLRKINREGVAFGLRIVRILESFKHYHFL